MKSSNTRQPLYQQAVPEQKGPFFSKANDDAKKKDDAFFQTKLEVGKKDDKQEKEADNVADKVQKKSEEKEKPDVQTKSKEDEKQGDKPAVSPQAPKGKDDEKKKVSKKEDDKKEADVQKKGKDEEEKPVQKMSDGDKKEDKTAVSKKEDSGKVEKDEPVMKKESAASHAAPHKISLEERIKRSKGKGQSLPDQTKSFLETELGVDLSEVVIHTDAEAIAMNKELNALAFTNGFDIYFNAGQYQPDSKAGQKLLAHELTHVIQQTGVSKKKNKK